MTRSRRDSPARFAHATASAAQDYSRIGRCVLNAAVDASQTVGDQRLDEVADIPSSTPETPDEDVRSALRRLPQRQRDALFLRVYLDFDYATIAETLNIEVGTVSATLHAARENLTQSLQEVT